MRYFGSKASTLDALDRLVSSRFSSGTLCDPFGGIGTVGAFFKSKGFLVYTGDLLTFAHYFQVSRITLSEYPKFQRLLRLAKLDSVEDIPSFLNRAAPLRNWFQDEYSIKRRFFIAENAGRIARAQKYISGWSDDEVITAREKAFLIASLINSMDKVANTAGTYYAYLKQWHRKARNPFEFQFIQPAAGKAGRACCCEAEALAASRHFNVLYLDPPYNERSYGSYYHLPETMAASPLSPKLHGMSGIPDGPLRRSQFNNRSQAGDALRRVLQHASFDLLIFHYSDDGLIPPKEVRTILGAHGRVKKFRIRSSGYTTKQIARVARHELYTVDHA